MSNDVTTTLPLFPLESVLVPGMELQLRIFEERYRRLLAERRREDPVFGVVLIRKGREVGDQPDVYSVGTTCSLISCDDHFDGTSSLMLVGRERFRIEQSDWDRGFLTADVKLLPEIVDDGNLCMSRADEATAIWREIVISLSNVVHGRQRSEVLADRALGDLSPNPTVRGYQIIELLPLDPTNRQALLEVKTTDDRLAELTEVLRTEFRLMTALGEHPTLTYQRSRTIHLN